MEKVFTDGELTSAIKQYRLKYYYDNKPHLLKLKKEYYQKINDKGLHTCECGKTIQQASIYNHNRGKRHIAFINKCTEK